MRDRDERFGVDLAVAHIAAPLCTHPERDRDPVAGGLFDRQGTSQLLRSGPRGRPGGGRDLDVDVSIPRIDERERSGPQTQVGLHLVGVAITANQHRRTAPGKRSRLGHAAELIARDVGQTTRQQLGDEQSARQRIRTRTVGTAPHTDPGGAQVESRAVHGSVHRVALGGLEPPPAVRGDPEER